MRRTYQNQTCQYQQQNNQVWTEAHLWTLKRREAGGSSIDIEIRSVWFANSWATGALTQWSSVLDEGRQCMIYCVMFGSHLWVLRVLWQLQPWTDEWRWPIDALHQKWLLLSSCSAWKYFAHNPLWYARKHIGFRYDNFQWSVQSRRWYFRPYHLILLAKKLVVIPLWWPLKWD